MDLIGIAALGILTGITIFLGLPIARMKNISAKTKSRLNALSVGILLFLLVDVLNNALSLTEKSILHAVAGSGTITTAIGNSVSLVIGLAIGLLGLVWYETRFIQSKNKTNPLKPPSWSEKRARQMAFMIALGIGFHNFSEGLAIGQSYADGTLSLALLLVVGFALHNATEGFGIAAPLTGFKTDWIFLIKMGLIGGGPTLIGTLLGSMWTSYLAMVFFFALAAGAIIYVIKEMLYHGRVHGEGLATMAFIIAGFLIGTGTDLIVTIASGG